MLAAHHLSTTEAAMSVTEIISILRDKRSKLADAIAQLERQVDRQRADLRHIEATIRLFDRKRLSDHLCGDHAGTTTGFVQANAAGASMTFCVKRGGR